MSLLPVVEKTMNNLTNEWYVEQLSMMEGVETDAMKGLSGYVNSIGKLNLAKDLIGLAKDGVTAFSVAGDKHSFVKFTGSWKYSVPMFVLSMVTTVYDDWYKSKVAQADFNIHQLIRDVDLDYRTRIKETKIHLKSFPFYRSLIGQITAFLDKSVQFGPTRPDLIETFVKAYIYELGVFPKPKEMYQIMMSGLGNTIKNLKLVHPLTYHGAGPYHWDLRRTEIQVLHGGVMYSERGSTFPSGFQKVSQSGGDYKDKWLKNNARAWVYLKTGPDMPAEVKKQQDQILANISRFECRSFTYNVDRWVYQDMEVPIVWCRKLRWKDNHERVTERTKAGKIEEKKMQKVLRENRELMKSMHGLEVQIR